MREQRVTLSLVDEGGDAVFLSGPESTRLRERGVIAACRDGCNGEVQRSSGRVVLNIHHIVRAQGRSLGAWARLAEALEESASAVDRITVHTRRGRLEPMSVFVPAPNSVATHGILPASGIVGTTDDGVQYTIDYEGNRWGATNLCTYANRVEAAAGRHRRAEETLARMRVQAEDLLNVGEWDGTMGRVEIRDERAAATLARWLYVPRLSAADLDATAQLYEMRRWNRARPRCAYSIESAVARLGPKAVLVADPPSSRQRPPRP